MKLIAIIIVFLFLNICLNINDTYSASIRQKRDLTADLISNSHLLISKAHNIITELTQQNRTQLAHTIDVYANAIENLAVKLNASTNQTEINQLQHSLSNIQGYLLIEFERAGLPAYDYEEFRLAIIIDSGETIERAVKEIEKLKQQNKTESAFMIDNDVKELNQTLNQLRNATLMYDVFITEEALVAQWTKLDKDLYHLGVDMDLENIRYIEFDRANSLTKQLTAVINKFKSDKRFENLILGKDKLIDELEEKIQKLANISSQLRNATDNNTIIELTFKFSEMILKQQTELAILDIEKVITQERQAFLHDIDVLDSTMETELRKLVQQNRTIEADVIRAEQEHLYDLRIAAKFTVYQLDLLYFELRFRMIDNIFKAQIVEFRKNFINNLDIN